MSSAIRQVDPARFIDSLVADMVPVRPAISWLRASILWAALSWVFVSIAIMLSGPLREGALAGLASDPRRTADFLIGLSVSLAAIAAALEIGVPGAPTRWRLCTPALLFLAAWLGFFVWAYGDAFALSSSVSSSSISSSASSVPPSLPALGLSMSSMLGKREHCFFQSLVFAVPPYLLALGLLRHRVLRADWASGAFAGGAAAAIPALWMQVACMDEAMHALQYHFSPVLLIGLAGALVARFALSRLIRHRCVRTAVGPGNT